MPTTPTSGIGPRPHAHRHDLLAALPLLATLMVSCSHPCVHTGVQRPEATESLVLVPSESPNDPGQEIAVVTDRPDSYFPAQWTPFELQAPRVVGTQLDDTSKALSVSAVKRAMEVYPPSMLKNNLRRVCLFRTLQ